MKKQRRYVRKGGFGQNPIPKDGIPKAKVGDKIRVLSVEEAERRAKCLG